MIKLKKDIDDWRAEEGGTVFFHEGKLVSGTSLIKDNVMLNLG